AVLWKAAIIRAMFVRALPLLACVFISAVQAAEPLALRVWPERPAGAAPETVVERGKDGVGDRSCSDVPEPTLRVYLPEDARAATSAVLILPGGGYDHLAIDKEGHDLGRWFSANGVVGVVLKYRLPFRADKRPSPEERAAAYADRAGGTRYMAVAV